MIHLDTSFVVDLIRETSRQEIGPASALLESLHREEIGISVFVVCELKVGVRLSNRSEQEEKKVRQICAPFMLVYPDERFPEVYGDALSDLRRRHLNVDVMDLLIGTTALVEGARLVTGNPRHFSYISNLEVLTYEKRKATSHGEK